MLDSLVDAQALQWHGDGRRVAAAIVLSTWGSAPRPVGARLYVRDDGEFAGSVSGGCIEGAVITAAAEALADGKPQQLSFGVADAAAWEVGLSCGGEISVLVHPFTAAAAECLRHATQQLATRSSAALFTRLDDGSQCLQTAAGAVIAGTATAAGDLTAAQFLQPPSAAALHGDVFVEPLAPPPRLLLIGATHIAQALLPLARQLAFECVVIDPRARWATAARFPDTDLHHAWPDEALAALKISEHDAVITLSHDPKIDDPALRAALAANPFYIGALGSRRTHAARLERLAADGIDAAEICAPVGLPLGATTASEIALSIIAQALQHHRRRGAE